MNNQSISTAGTNLIADLTKRIEELIAQRQNYIMQANMEINHQVGVYDGQIGEIQRVINILTPTPEGVVSGNQSPTLEENQKSAISTEPMPPDSFEMDEWRARNGEAVAVPWDKKTATAQTIK